MTFETLLPQLTAIATKLGGAIILWIVGRFVIKLALKAISASLIKSKVDSTLAKWIGAIGALVGNFLLAIAVLSVFGVETGLVGSGGFGDWGGVGGAFVQLCGWGFLDFVQTV
jgi:small-conductance mechanosensitive channel